MTQNRKTPSSSSSSAGASGEQLLLALRRCAARAGVAALRSLGRLVSDAVDDGGAAEVEPSSAEFGVALGFELARVLGAELGEHTPTTLDELAALMAGVEGAPEEIGARAALAPIASELRASSRRLREGSARAADGLLSPSSIGELRDTALLERECQRRLAERCAVPNPLRAESVATSRALRADVAYFDPVALLRLLRSWFDERLEKVRAALSEIHRPIRIETNEALAVAEWLVLDGPRPARRAALLELARELDGFCRRAPLAEAERERLRKLARAADGERDDPAWQAVADRVWTLRERLLGSTKRPMPPLYRSLVGGDGHRAASPRPPRGASIEAILGGPAEHS